MTIEFHQGTTKVNETKVRKDHDEWHDVLFPAELADPPFRNSAKAPAQAAAPRPGKEETSAQVEPSDTQLAEEVYTALWDIRVKGTVDFKELFAGSGHASLQSDALVFVLVNMSIAILAMTFTNPRTD